MKYFLFLLLLLFASCSPSNLNELRYEGEAEMKKLTADLKKLESYEEVQKASKKLRKHFNRIGELLIATRNFSSPGFEEPSAAGEELFAELARIYEIPGARAVIEAAQKEAIHRLDSVKPTPL